jgi:hypothetical protein
MFHRNRLIQGLAFALVLMAFAVTPAQAQKKRPRSVSSGPPFVELAANRNTIRVCAGEDSTVQLRARATSNNGHVLRYKWATDGGRITGDGADTTWDLAGMRPGVYRATLEVDSGYDDTCAAFSTAAVLVTDCPVIAPSCPTVTINCPTDAPVFGEVVTVSANISGGAGLGAPDYNWTVSAGRIVEGQGTRTIRIDTAGAAGQNITATVDVRAAGLSCPASCSLPVATPRQECRKFDEFPKLPRNDEKARLDNFAIDLQNTPGSSAYIVVYPARASRTGETEQHTNRIVDYLVSYRGIDAGRIIRLIGPVGQDFRVELWTCPPGVRPSGLLR